MGEFSFSKIWENELVHLFLQAEGQRGRGLGRGFALTPLAAVVGARHTRCSDSVLTQVLSGAWKG